MCLQAKTTYNLFGLMAGDACIRLNFKSPAEQHYDGDSKKQAFGSQAMTVTTPYAP